MTLSLYDKKTYTVYLNSEDRQSAYTQYNGGGCTATASINGRQLTVAANVPTGSFTNIVSGMIVSGNYFLNNTYITRQISGTLGGNGVYNLNYAPSEPATFVISAITGNMITISSVSVGTVGVGMALNPVLNNNINYRNGTLPTVDAWWIPPNTYIIALGTGTGGAGTYYLNQYLPVSLLLSCRTISYQSTFRGTIDNATNVLLVSSLTSIDSGGWLNNGSFGVNLVNGSTTATVYVTSSVILCNAGVVFSGVLAGYNFISQNAAAGQYGDVGQYTLNTAYTGVTGGYTVNFTIPSIFKGMVVTGNDIRQGTYITGQISGVTGQAGVYTLNQVVGTLATTNITITVSMSVLQVSIINNGPYVPTTLALTLPDCYNGLDNFTVSTSLSKSTDGLGYYLINNYLTGTGLQSGPAFPANSIVDFYQQYEDGRGVLNLIQGGVYTGSWGEMDADFNATVLNATQLTITALNIGGLALPSGTYTGSQLFYNGVLIGTVSSFTNYNYSGLIGTTITVANSNFTVLTVGQTYNFTSITADENWNSAIEGPVLISNPPNSVNVYNSLPITNFSLRNKSTFQINWADILPLEHPKYKVLFSFQTSGGAYKDITTDVPNTIFSQAKIFVDFQGKSYSFDSGTKGHSNLMGVIMRDIQTTTSNSNILSCWHGYNSPKTIDRPTQNNITISLVNTNNNLPFVDTYTSGAISYLAQDCTPWTMILEFIPIN